MFLRGADGNELGLDIARYEFPDETHDWETANWLEMTLRVRNSEGYGWCQSDCMMTRCRGLAGWFETLAKNQEPGLPYHLSPEPNLQMKFVERSVAAVTLAVRFILERPGEWTIAGQRDERSYWQGDMTLAVARDQLRAAAQDLRQQLTRYPERLL